MLVVISPPNRLAIFSLPYVSMLGAPNCALTNRYTPSVVPFLVLMLIIPDLPSGSYLADGAVTISISAITLAGNWLKNAVTSPVMGRPCNRTRKPVDPRIIILPSTLTDTEGIFRSTSTAEPPVADWNWSAWYIFAYPWYGLHLLERPVRLLRRVLRRTW